MLATFKRLALATAPLILAISVSGCSSSGNPGIAPNPNDGTQKGGNPGNGGVDQGEAIGKQPVGGQPGASVTPAQLAHNPWCMNGTLQDGRQAQERYAFTQTNFQYTLFELSNIGRGQELSQAAGTYSIAGNQITFRYNGGQAVATVRFSSRDGATGADRIYVAAQGSQEMPFDPCN